MFQKLKKRQKNAAKIKKKTERKQMTHFQNRSRYLLKNSQMNFEIDLLKVWTLNHFKG